MKYSIDDTDDLKSQTEIKERIQKRKEKDEQIKKIVSNDKYILWLEQFTIKNPYFSDDNWKYLSDITLHNQSNVGKLQFLFEGIMRYASKYYIYPHIDQWGYYYPIHYQNIGYCIGKLHEQEALFYCERTPILEGSIHFDDIIHQRAQKQTDEIQQRFDQISQMIDQLVEMKIPSFAIKEEVCKIIDHYSKNDVSKTKKK